MLWGRLDPRPLSFDGGVSTCLLGVRVVSMNRSPGCSACWTVTLGRLLRVGLLRAFGYSGKAWALRHSSVALLANLPRPEIRLDGVGVEDGDHVPCSGKLQHWLTSTRRIVARRTLHDGATAEEECLKYILASMTWND